MNYDRIFYYYSIIKGFQSFIIESFIKLAKHLTGYSSSNLLENLKIDYGLLFTQNAKEKDNDMNNIRNDRSEFLSPDKVDLSLIFFFKEILKFFINIINYKAINGKNNKELSKINSILNWI
jgi:hypothetical protein